MDIILRIYQIFIKVPLFIWQSVAAASVTDVYKHRAAPKLYKNQMNLSSNLQGSGSHEDTLDWLLQVAEVAKVNPAFYLFKEAITEKFIRIRKWKLGFFIPNNTHRFYVNDLICLKFDILT